MSNFYSQVTDDNFSQCLKCIHDNVPADGGCKAFPKGIPYAILANEHDHRLPYEGDNGILFQKRPPKQPE
jgi:hypothetical protein